MKADTELLEYIKERKRVSDKCGIDKESDEYPFRKAYFIGKLDSYNDILLAVNESETVKEYKERAGG